MTGNLPDKLNLLPYQTETQFCLRGLELLTRRTSVTENWKDVSTFRIHSQISFVSLVMPMLQAFNASDRKWSPYASMVQLELLEVTNSTNTDYAVRLLYHGEERRLPCCSSSPCSMAEFSEYIKTIVPQDPASECKITDPGIMTGPPPPLPSKARVLY